jgi:hypothetical protein
VANNWHKFAELGWTNLNQDWEASSKRCLLKSRYSTETKRQIFLAIFGSKNKRHAYPACDGSFVRSAAFNRINSHKANEIIDQSAGVDEFYVGDIAFITDGKLNDCGSR